MNSIWSKIEGDRVIWLAVLLLMMVSALVVWSAGGVLGFRYLGGEVEYYLIKHMLILMAGFLIMFYLHRTDYKIFMRIAPLLMLLSIPLLGYTLWAGAEINQARRWLRIPLLNLTFQTSDFARLALILYLARELAIVSSSQVLMTRKRIWLRVFLPALGTVILIIPANLSTALLLLCVVFTMVLVSKIPFRWVLELGGVMVVSIVALVGAVAMSGKLERLSTWKSRVESYLSGEHPYQVEQSLIALASGDLLWGRGPGRSLQRYRIPHAYSDFVFAIIVEEYGYWLGALVLLTYLLIYWRAVRAALLIRRGFAFYTALGVGIMLFLQAIIHIGVVTGVFPATGQQLPLVSMGGTSILFTCAGLGILLAMSRVAYQGNTGREEKKIFYHGHSGKI